MTTTPPLPLSANVVNATSNLPDELYSSLKTLDCKCNQLQRDLFTLEQEMNSKYNKLNWEMAIIKEEQREYQQRQNNNNNDTQSQGVVFYFYDKYVGIYHYPLDNVGYLIGEKGHRIKKIENKYGVSITIPSKRYQTTSPIIVEPKYFTYASQFISAVYHILSILNYRLSLDVNV